MDMKYLARLRDFYKRELLDNILPFWIAHSKDQKYGGYHTCLSRDGSVYDYDKLCMWSQGRMVWAYSCLYNEMEQNPEWIEMARSGVDFIQKYGFGKNGEMYYALTRDGRPLQPAQDVFVELFTAMGFSEFARATCDDTLYKQAKEIFLGVWEKLGCPGRAFQPFLTQTRPIRIHGHSIISLNVLQVLRQYREEPSFETMIDQCLDVIINLHMKKAKKASFEIVAWDGGEITGHKGRWINPGHMIEGGIFIIHEGRRRKNKELVRTGIDLIDWGFEWGWDRRFGGVFNDVDSQRLPVPTLDTFMYQSKLWWQHAEALYGMLLAYCLTENHKFLRNYILTHNYSFSKFADPKYGEWFTALDRRGNRVLKAKGEPRKSVFHIARNFYLCYKLLEEITRQ